MAYKPSGNFGHVHRYQKCSQSGGLNHQWKVEHESTILKNDFSFEAHAEDFLILYAKRSIDSHGDISF